jgi:hypothetical protein
MELDSCHPAGTHATVLALGILRRPLDFWKIIVHSSCDGVRSVMQGSSAFSLRRVVFVVRRCCILVYLISFSQCDDHCLHEAISRVLHVARRYLASKGKGRISKFLECVKFVNCLCLNSTFSAELLSLKCYFYSVFC